MSFEEWVKSRSPLTGEFEGRGLWRQCWDAAQQAMQADGWRQCAVGQRTTQWCGQLNAAVLAEREACAGLCGDLTNYEGYDMRDECADAIRARSEEN